MTARGPRGEYAGTAQRRREIVEAAIQVFSENGFRDGSLRDVAERAGITHAGIRHHFPSKVELLEAVLTWRDQESLTRSRLGGHREGVGVLHAWLEAIAHNRSTPILVELEMTLSAEATSPDHPAHEYFRRQREQAIKILRTAFRRIEEQGDLSSAFSPDSAARAVVASTIGLQSLWLLDRSIDVPGELERVMQAFVTVSLREGITATAPW
jgi:AcrR family transcriptional regulator